MYKLIASDIDLTLINKDFLIPQLTLSAIRRCLKKDISFMLASGRIFGSVRPYAKFLGLDTPVICCNGALIMDTKTHEAYYSKPLQRVAAADIFNRLDASDLYYHFYTKEAFYARRFPDESDYISRMTKNLKEDEKFPVLETNDPGEVAKAEDIYKISIRLKKEEDEDLFKKAMTGMEGISITSSFKDNFEITANGVNKGEALKAYAKGANIKREEIIAFGDNKNDIEMLEYAGVGVAVANAEKEVKEVADMVTDTNENDGVGKTLLRLIFNE